MSSTCQALPLRIAPAPWSYDDNSLLARPHVGRCAAAIVVASALDAVRSAAPELLLLPDFDQVRRASVLSSSSTADAIETLTRTGALRRGQLHAPSLLHRNECGAGLAAWGFASLRKCRRPSARRLMVELVRLTPYGRAGILACTQQLATVLSCDVRTVYAALDTIANEYGLITWDRSLLAGVIRVTFSLTPGALALLAFPIDEPTQWG